MKFWAYFAFAVAGLVAAGAAPRGTEHRVPGTLYARWSHGPSPDPAFFPIAVWLQDPARAADYRAAGINLYVGLWEGPTQEKLDRLRAAGMPIFLQQTPQALAFKADPIIVGWTHQDEPDNAQEVTDPKTGHKGYGPCVPPVQVVADYQRMRAADPSRPVMLNLGQGVANDAWLGRGVGAKPEDYRTYVRGTDIASFDVYPVAQGLKPLNGDPLGYVPQGVDRLVRWTGGRKPVWNCIECTHIDGAGQATPGQVRAEVWRALVHGSRGLIYFVHQFKPTFDEHALLDDPEMLRAVTAINRQVRTAAPLLNSPTVPGGAVVTASPAQAPIEWMVKRREGDTYVLAVETRDTQARGEFAVSGLTGKATAEVLGEGRRIPVNAGRFTDDFAPYGVHVYRLR